MNQSLSEVFEKQLPYYLTQERKEGLIKELNSFPDNINYYLNKYFYQNDILQGDIFADMEIYKYNDSKKIKTHGIILSNSCDISEDNERYKEVFVTFCPIISLEKFKLIIEKQGKNFSSIESDIKNQKITDIFYLPKETSLPTDHIALLNQAVSIPYTLINKKQKKISLSQVGFYMFLFKLSIHYCRFHENITRSQNHTAN